jgi:phenylacetic acid degradation operon negative regulatory protein
MLADRPQEDAATMAMPALSRRPAAVPRSARDLLLTVMGEFMLPGDGTAWTSAMLAVFGRLGVEEKAARQALMRTASAGWLEGEKVGRRARWRLTAGAREMLTDGAARIYSFTGAAEDWDGRWLLVSVRVPESDRRARRILRTRLSWAGFGSLANGLWITPHPKRKAEASAALREAGVAADAHIFTATHSGMTEVKDMVASAWDLTEIEQSYEDFIARFRVRIPSDVLACQIELVDAWRRFPAIDPALPRDLLPPRWSGLTAARLFAEKHERWAPDARHEWERLNRED